MQQKIVKGIQIHLTGYDHKLLDQSAHKIVHTAMRTGAKVKGPVPLPVRRKTFTVNRSPHIDKKSREQFQMLTYRRLINIIDSTPQTVDALMKLDLATGIEVNITL